MKPVYESDGSATPAHADSNSEEGRCDRQANPQTRTDRKWNGPTCIVGSIALPRSMIAVPSAPPVKRRPIKEPKYVVLKATFSTMPMVSGGNAAQRIGARRAQPEINKSQA